MPLLQSKSPEAFRTNVAEMIRGGHPRAQALAAAYRVQRGHAAGGGVDLPPGSFELPDDVVGALGHGDPVAGESVLHHMFGSPRVLHPEVVKAIGHGDSKAGRKVLREFIRLTRNKHAATMPYRS